jgi:hypothetical protein
VANELFRLRSRTAGPSTDWEFFCRYSWKVRYSLHVQSILTYWPHEKSFQVLSCDCKLTVNSTAWRTALTENGKYCMVKRLWFYDVRWIWGARRCVARMPIIFSWSRQGSLAMGRVILLWCNICKDLPKFFCGSRIRYGGILGEKTIQLDSIKPSGSIFVVLVCTIIHYSCPHNRFFGRHQLHCMLE